MVKPLSFKGDPKPKKRKRVKTDGGSDDESKKVTKAGEDAIVEEDDSWVSADVATDIGGPVIIALPTDPIPTCLACDANGEIFASPLENIVERDLSTAEPHDVRQVWVANRVSGTETFSFKGHHGRYLCADKFGILSASREAMSAEEQFNCIPAPDTPSMFCIQTQRDLFLTVSAAKKPTAKKPSTAPEIRADAELISFNTTFRIRMQARFKPRLRANKENRAKEHVSRKELEEVVGRRLNEEEVKKLKKARREGTYHEAVLDTRVKGKHDKFAS